MITFSTFFLYINFFSHFLFLCFSLTTEPNYNYYLQVFIEHPSITIKQKKSQYICQDLLSNYQKQRAGRDCVLGPCPVGTQSHSNAGGLFFHSLGQHCCRIADDG